MVSKSDVNGMAVLDDISGFRMIGASAKGYPGYCYPSLAQVFADSGDRGW